MQNLRLIVFNIYSIKEVLWRVRSIKVTTKPWVIRLAGLCCVFVRVCVQTHANMTSLRLLSQCNVKICCIFFPPPYRMLYISLCRVLWTGSGRPWGFLWKRSTTACCLEVCGNDLSFSIAYVELFFLGLFLTSWSFSFQIFTAQLNTFICVPLQFAFQVSLGRCFLCCSSWRRL